MRTEKTVEEIYQKLLSKNFEYSRRFSKGGYTPENLRKFLQYLGNPQDKYPVIHIAGTVAKGSVSQLLAEGYSQLGERVGLYTSPHLMRLNERIKVEGKDILDEEFIDIYETLEKKFKEFSLSFFDILTAIAFLYFAQKKISIAVLETGLGGRLDSTNVVESKVAILTPIGLDHQNVLGNTIEEIAHEKAGIIKENSVVYSMIQEKEAEKVLRGVAQEKKAKIYFPHYEINFDYRKTNISFVEAYFLLQENKKISLGSVDIRARFEQVLPPYYLYFDSAHNVVGMENLAGLLLNKFPYKKITIVFNCLKERSAQALLAPFFNNKNFVLFKAPWEIPGGHSNIEIDGKILPKIKESELYQKVFVENEVVVTTGSMRLYKPMQDWLNKNKVYGASGIKRLKANS